MGKSVIRPHAVKGAVCKGKAQHIAFHRSEIKTTFFLSVPQKAYGVIGKVSRSNGKPHFRKHQRMSPQTAAQIKNGFSALFKPFLGIISAFLTGLEPAFFFGCFPVPRF